MTKDSVIKRRTLSVSTIILFVVTFQIYNKNLFLRVYCRKNA